MRRFFVSVVLALLTGVLCNSASAIKIAHGPYLQNLGEEEVTIVWLSDKVSVGWVELEEYHDYSFYKEEHPRHFDTDHGIKNTSTIHVVKIKGLKPGVKYRYRVFAQEILEHTWNKVVYGDYASTDVYSRKPLTFTTLDSKRETVSFAMVNDIHEDNKLLEDLIGKCDLKKTDLVLFNGDMTNFLNDEKEIFDGFMDKATELFASEIPMYYTRGNHETRGAFTARIQDYFSPKEEHLYYTFRQGPVFFVMLDTGEDKPDSDIEYYGINCYDDYRTEQAEWLKEVLESREYKEAPYKVIVAHVPPIGDWHGDQEVRKKFMTLLNGAGPDIMLCGHLHRFIHQEPDAETPFPVIVNANTSVLKAVADDKEMTVEIIDQDGKQLDKFSVRKK